MLQPEVVVQVTGEMLLDAEEARLALARAPRLLRVALGLGRPGEVPLALIIVERYRTPPMSCVSDLRNTSMPTPASIGNTATAASNCASGISS